MAVLVRGKNTRKPYTVRWWLNGKQREKSFVTRKEATDFKTRVEYESRTQSFVDPKLGSIRFGDYAESVVGSMAVAPNTLYGYRTGLKAWTLPYVGDRTLAQIAVDREGVTNLVNNVMRDATGKLLSYSRRNAVRGVIVAVLDEAVRAGRLQNHRLSDIDIVTSDELTTHADFVFPAYEQIRLLSAALASFGPVVWLMRGCGLRISEALAVHREDFLEDGAILRVSGQSAAREDRKIPLKRRKAGEYRDVPVPAYLWEIVKDLPNGPVCPDPRTGGYIRYLTVYKRFISARAMLGIPEGFTPHSLRHAFASALLANGVPITEVAAWLGHRNIAVTYQTYAHLIPSAASRGRSVLDAEYSQWSAQQDRSSEH